MRRLFLSLLLVLLVASAGSAQEEKAAGLKLKVAELAQSVDLSRGKEKFLTVTVEISGTEPRRLRRVQPLREDFQVLAGKTMLRCRWLRGGSVPEDPDLLRFVLGFSLPPEGTRTVSLLANLPRLEGNDALELALTNLQLNGGQQDRKGPGWSLSVYRFQEVEYTPPALPPSGKFHAKGGPVDARIFRKGEAAPERAIVLSIRSTDVDLYDPTLDVTGALSAPGPDVALLSALMRRDPSKTVKDPPYGPFVTADFYFPVPPKGAPTGAVIRLQRRPPNAEAKPLRIDNLPVP